MRQFNTLIEFISSKSLIPAINDTVELQGYSVAGDGGKVQLKHNGVTGQTPSQSPTQLNANLVNDGSGNQWVLITGQLLNYSGIQWFPLPFGGAGNGGYLFDSNGWAYIETPSNDSINDLSLTYDFPTVALFKASTILFPNGKRVYLTDRDAYFNKITGNTATTDNDIIFSTAVNQSIVLITQGLAVSEQFGFSTKDQLQTFLASDGNQYTHEAYGRFSTLNGRDDTVGVFDVANFAGQTAYSSEPIGFVFHHYTDGTLMQVDNVGQANNILILKNAQNTNRRPDKASDFVGTGNFLALDTHNDSLGYTERYFYIDKDAKFVWTGVKGIATLWQNKAEDGVPAFRSQTTNNHSVLSDFVNALSTVVYRFKNDVTFTRFTIESDVSQTSGMLFETKAGGIRLLPANGKLETGGAIQAISGNTLITAPSAKMTEFQTPVLLRQYSTATLPSASVYANSTVSISDSAGKPSPLVYSNGTNWLYMDNTTV